MIFLISTDISFVSADLFWTDKIDNDIIWTADDIELSVHKIIANFLKLTYLLLTMYIFYAWFLIFNAAWDEEKVKKAKTIVIQVVIWFVVIFLAWSINKFIFESVTNTSSEITDSS